VLSYVPEKKYLDKIGFTYTQDVPLYQAGSGCEECRHTGYKGRTGIYEMLDMDESIRRMALEKTSSGNIKKEALRNGMRTLREDGWEKVRAGITTIDEVIRVTQEEELF
jgi:type II secretory ATPase GspE/PulE/Tfp pilus assembly ATPase PilB-like protein